MLEILETAEQLLARGGLILEVLETAELEAACYVRGSRPSRVMRIAHACGEARTEEQLREHYCIERELANRLRRAGPAERRVLYSALYDELLRRVPHHPMLSIGDRGHRQRAVDHQLAFLDGFLAPDSIFMEIGPGDCALALRAAVVVTQVYAIDVSEQITRDVTPPRNFRLILSDGCSIPVPPGTVDVAFSDQLMEHLHPDDAKQQLRNIYDSLAPHGVYICVTPNRLYGPRDISAYFDDVATGFHLREYAARDLRDLLAAAGFGQIHFYAGARGRFVRCPGWLIFAVERVLDALPHRVRRALADRAPMRALLGVRVAAFKGGGAARAGAA
jgi:SAM-dependent methyltransferase